MSKTYTATSLKFTGWVEFTFNDTGLLTCLNMADAQVNDEQRLWLWEHRPHTEMFIQDYATKSKLTIVLKLIEVTFEQFYEAYGVKEGKKKAEAAWKKLPPAEQVKAYHYIPRLRTKKQISTEALPYPATYLNQARWND